MSLLPVELLARVFVLCLPPRPYPEPRTHAAPLLFTQVCHRWRDVALQTPGLWSSLSAVRRRHVTLLPMREARVHAYAAWLSRSGNRPLSLAVPFEYVASPTRVSQEWLDLLRSYRHRFHRLCVVDAHGIHLNDLLDGAHMLNLLAVYSEPLHDRGNDILIAHPLPSLRTLVLSSFHIRTATLPAATWANLTHLAVRLPYEPVHSTDDFLVLLSRCPNLRTFIFGPLTERSTAPPELQLQPPPSYPNLRLLTVFLGDSDELNFWTAPAMLTLPALLSLRLSYKLGDHWDEDVPQCDEDDEDGAVNLALPHRYFRAVVSEDEQFLMFDVGWTNITHLDLAFSGDVNVFPMVLDLCPNLQVLEVAGSNSSNISTSLYTPVTYPSLCELSVRLFAPLGNFLQALTLPGLRRLTIYAACCGERDDVRAMLLRSGCPLESLTVRDMLSRCSSYWTEEEREDLFTSLPTLTLLQH